MSDETVATDRAVINLDSDHALVLFEFLSQMVAIWQHVTRDAREGVDGSGLRCFDVAEDRALVIATDVV